MRACVLKGSFLFPFAPFLFPDLQPLKKNVLTSFRGDSDGEAMLRVRLDGMAESALKSASELVHNKAVNGGVVGGGGRGVLAAVNVFSVILSRRQLHPGCPVGYNCPSR